MTTLEDFYLDNEWSKPRGGDRMPYLSQQPKPLCWNKYFGRVYAGWFVVDWDHIFAMPEKRVDAWIDENAAGKWAKCPINGARRFFEDEQDALMCFMAFK